MSQVEDEDARQNAQSAKAPGEWVEPSLELDEAARRFIGAAIEVHRTIGPGFSEAVYERALCIELRARAIGFVRQRRIVVEYKGEVVGEGQLDLVIEPGLIVELKSVPTLLPVHKAQLRSYLIATRSTLGLLVNFDAEIVTVKRVIQSRHRVPTP